MKTQMKFAFEGGNFLNKKRKGYSLMELITTMAIISVVLIITLLMFNNMMKTVNRTLAKIETIQELLKLDDAIRNEVIKAGMDSEAVKITDDHKGFMFKVDIPAGSPTSITKYLTYVKNEKYPKGALLLKEKVFEENDFPKISPPDPNALSWEKENVLAKPEIEATVSFNDYSSGILTYSISVQYRDATLTLNSRIPIVNLK